MSETYPNAAGRMADVAHYRFGTFDLDVKSGELRRSGVKVRLQEQPFQVLRKLLEGRGELVTREELQGALWPADTYVDFDTSLNTAIKRLREALGDSADLPVFIETVPRRGYRFLAPVQEDSRPNGNVIGIDKTIAVEEKEPTAARKKGRGAILTAVLAVVAILAVAVAAWRWPSTPPRVTDSAQLTFDGVSKGNLQAAAGSIYFNELIGTQIALKKLSVGGGTATTISQSNPGLFLCDVSRDGMRFLVMVGGLNAKGKFRLKVMEAGTSSLSDLHGLEVTDCSWGPGGKVLFAQDESLFLADVDGSNPRKLLTGRGTVARPRFSPDGKRVRFTMGDKLSYGLWEANADGSGQHELFAENRDFPQKCCGIWSPDGRYFFYQGTRDGASRIFAVKENKFLFWEKEGAPVQLTALPLNFFLGTLSEDGKKLITTAAQPRARLERYDERTKQFLPYLGGISAGDVEESRDGQWMVYVKYPEQTLWRARNDGSEALELTGPLMRGELPHWSPDGKWIAFSGAREGHTWNIFLVSPDGGAAEQLTSGPVSDLDASWSPDGKTIVFGQIRIASAPIVSIQFLDVATHKVSAMKGSDGICCPRWSPDGKYMLATHSDNTDLVLYDFAAAKWSTILKDYPGIGYMKWASDSKSVIFDTADTKEPGFFRLHIPDGRVETIVSMENIIRYYGEFGPWGGTTADGAPLLVRDVGIEEMYTLDLQLP